MHSEILVASSIVLINNNVNRDIMKQFMIQSLGLVITESEENKILKQETISKTETYIYISRMKTMTCNFLQ